MQAGQQATQEGALPKLRAMLVRAIVLIGRTLQIQDAVKSSRNLARTIS